MKTISQGKNGDPVVATGQASRPTPLQRIIKWIRCLLLMEVRIPKPSRSDAGRLEYAPLTQQEEDVFNEHSRWVKLHDTGLSPTDWGEVVLAGKNLQGRIFSRASLEDADFTGSLLGRGDPETRIRPRIRSPWAKVAAETVNDRCAQFDGAALDRATFRHADLTGVDLSNATGLRPDRLGGAKLEDARLDEKIHWTPHLKQVEELAKNAGGPFFSGLITVAFAWVTIGSTTDIALLTNSGATKLPLVGLDVDLSGAYVSLPIVLLGVFIYLHLHLNQLWKVMSKLPAVFPDGQSLVEKSHPWLVCNFASKFVPNLNGTDPALTWTLRLWIFATTWFAIPFTLYGIWVGFLPKHELMISGTQVLAIAVGVLFGTRSYRQAAYDLSGVRISRIAWIPALSIVILIAFVTFFAIEGISTKLPPIFRLRANLNNTVVSQKPGGAGGHIINPNPTPHNDKYVKQIQIRDEQVLGAHIKEGANLRSLSANYAYLENARMIRADLRGAELFGANLRFASLFEDGDLPFGGPAGASFENANLIMSDFTGADLAFANLSNVNASRGLFVQTRFDHAKLSNALIGRSKLNRATFIGADLSRARLPRSDLTGANLSGANLRRAILHQTIFTNAILKGTDLTGASLNEADFRGAVLDGAILTGATYNSKTRLPHPRFRFDDHGAKLVGSMPEFIFPKPAGPKLNVGQQGR